MRIRNGYILSAVIVSGISAAAITLPHEQSLCDDFRNSQEGVDLAKAIASFEEQNPGANVDAKIQKKGLNCAL